MHVIDVFHITINKTTRTITLLVYTITLGYMQAVVFAECFTPNGIK